jgi:hypothetical protein
MNFNNWMLKMNGLQMKYFVLNPTSSNKEFAEASRIAIYKFADEIVESNLTLAMNLRMWIDEIRIDEQGG